MAETLQQLVELFKQQLEAQNERIELQQRQMEKQMEVRQEQMEQLIAWLGPPPKEIAGTQPVASIPNFMPFDSISELWKDYLARFYWHFCCCKLYPWRQDCSGIPHQPNNCQL